MKALIILSFTLLVAIPSMAFADCSDQACVNVFTKDNQIIIEAHKGVGAISTKRVPAPKASATPTLWFPPKASPASKPYVKRSNKARTARARIVTKSANLSDRLTKLVPTGGVAFQPEFDALTNVPVIYWIDVPEIFQSRVSIIGEVVDVALRPAFIWSFGDGFVRATTNPGAAYPNQSITHTYTRPGTYSVIVITTWNGSFTHNGAVRAISGKIIKTSVALVTVVSAPTRFTK